MVRSIPFANPGDPVHSGYNLLLPLSDYPASTVTSGEWSLLYSPQDGVPELYHLPSGPSQVRNAIGTPKDIAGEIHQFLVRFMRETGLPERLLTPRLELRM